MSHDQGSTVVADSGGPRPPASPPGYIGRLRPVLLVSLVGVGLSAVLFGMVRGYELKRHKDDFRTYAQAHASQIQRRMEADREALLSIQHLYAASREVEADEFRDFVRGPLERHKEILSLEWLPRITAAQRGTFEKTNNLLITEMDEQGNLLPAQPRSEYFPAEFVESAQSNHQARLFDHASSPIRLLAMAQARDSANPALTTPVSLMWKGSGQRATVCLMFVPIYRNGVPHDTPEQREQNLAGFAASMLLVPGLVEESLSRESLSRMDLFLYDGRPGRSGALLHAHRANGAPGTPRSFADELADTPRPVFWDDSFPFAGRQWRVLCRPSSQFGSPFTWESWALLCGGLLITALLCIYLNTVLNNAAHVRRVITERTGELASANLRLQTEMDERGRVEDALRASEERIRLIVDKAHDAFVAMDTGGRIIEWNVEASATFGWKRDEAIGRGLAETIIPPQYRDAHTRGLARYLATGAGPVLNNRLEISAMHRDGREFPVELTITAIRSADTPFFAAFIRDITERKRAEQALQNSEALYHSLVESLPLNILRKDMEGRVTFGNKRYCQTMGRRLVEIVGKTDHDFFTRELAEKYVADDRKVMATREVFEDIEENRNPQGERRFVHVLKGPVFDARGDIVGTQTIFWDVTARKEAEEQLKHTTAELARSNAELEQFAYVASHDLQEPIRTIVNFLQLLNRRYQGKLDQDADEFIGFAVDGAKRMQALIKDLLDYSRVGTKGAPPRPMDSTRSFDAAVANLSFTIEESGAVVMKGPLPAVMADEVQLSQLFQNLIGNAIKFRGDKAPRVQVSASPTDGMWQFTVRDEGIGIDPRHFERIFVIFQRLHTRDEYPGTGIGLAVCKKIVERHGGRIWLESEPGQGAVFHFTLPAAKDIPVERTVVKTETHERATTRPKPSDL